jgi:hypothetical protein
LAYEEAYFKEARVFIPGSKPWARAWDMEDATLHDRLPRIFGSRVTFETFERFGLYALS